jgi:hypothetical protein
MNDRKTIQSLRKHPQNSPARSLADDAEHVGDGRNRSGQTCSGDEMTADHLIRAAAHDTLERSLKASQEYEAVKAENVLLKSENAILKLENNEYRFGYRWILGFTQRALNVHDPRLREIGEFIKESFGIE